MGLSNLESRSQLAELAELLVPLLAPGLAAEVRRHLTTSPNGEYVKGTLAISRFLGVSEDTFRRRFAKQIPICGYETFNHRGKINVRPICRRDELTAFRENLPQSSRRTRLTTQPA